MQSFVDHHPRGSATWPDLTAAQLASARSAVQEIAEEHRRRLEENEVLFRTLASDTSIDAAERQSARLAATAAFEVCQQAGRALAAMDSGTYGRCAACGQQIPFERLEALPLADSCVSCPPG